MNVRDRAWRRGRGDHFGLIAKLWEILKKSIGSRGPGRIIGREVKRQDEHPRQWFVRSTDHRRQVPRSLATL